ncbi:hypothetical protein SAMN05192533_12169 [Mesobacillus persicus]|uniref:Uncharacterized protein n=1 Tax=Mesobacillus persicus TaxID=930146 RepID=A0A1H8JLH4_9BACI|nr:hypothetical protein [Mesobacillus persicus]SEN81186.1 hypothetical protein SAMN05192533_12169 [Mesobacillus persicus]
MSRDLNVEEALKILKEFYITDSIQMLSRWIREGSIVASRTDNRKDGWRITIENLYEFIEKKRPGWPRILALYKQDIDELELEPDINEEFNRLATKTETNEEGGKTVENPINENSRELGDENTTLNASTNNYEQEKSIVQSTDLDILKKQVEELKLQQGKIELTSNNSIKEIEQYLKEHQSKIFSEIDQLRQKLTALDQMENQLKKYIDDSISKTKHKKENKTQVNKNQMSLPGVGKEEEWETENQ